MPFKVTFEPRLWPIRSNRSNLLVVSVITVLLPGCTNVASLKSVGAGGVTLVSLPSERDLPSEPSLLRQLQERTFKNPKAIIFGSVINTLADLGFRVTVADKQSGFITAAGGGQDHIVVGFRGLSRESDVSAVSIFMEERGTEITVVRAIFAQSTLSPAGGRTGEQIIKEPAAYDSFFDRLVREINLASHLSSLEENAAFVASGLGSDATHSHMQEHAEGSLHN